MPGPEIEDQAVEYKVDLLEEVEKKITKNEEKYPVHKEKCSAKKYTEL